MLHLIHLEYIQHISKDGKILWEDKDLYNVLHTDGEEFILRAVFLGGKTSNTYIPNYYYFGLDNRTTPAISDTMSDLVSEPFTNGYVRGAIASTSEFTLSTSSGNKKISSPILTFQATGGSWGPVKSLFLTDKSDDSGYLISSVPLSSALTLNSGESINLRMNLVLKDDS